MEGNARYAASTTTRKEGRRHHGVFRLPLVEAEMAVFVLLLSLQVASLLQLPKAQELEFLVLKTSVSKEQAISNLRNRNPYVLGGQNMTILCAYRIDKDTGTDYCAKKTDPKLTLRPLEDRLKLLAEQHMVTVESTACNVTVEFFNMTYSLGGAYVCEDVNNDGILRQRNISVGEIPVTPENLQVVYKPLDTIALRLKPVKRAKDLNAPSTKWKVTYTWNGSSHHCATKLSDRRCRNLKEDGYCQPCVIVLKKYDGCGMYGSMGSILDSEILFTVSVENLYGNADAAKQFYLAHWVKPGPVNRIDIKQRGSSWFLMSVRAPKNFDQAHFDAAWSSENGLSLDYTVKFVPVKQQNLPYEELRNIPSVFIYHSSLIKWESEKEKCQKKDHPRRMLVNVTGLPYAGSHYSVSVRSRAHYWSEPFLLDSSVQTTEEAPSRGPGLEEQFALCLPTDQSCTTCFIYFQAIPWPWARGVIRNHTLTMTLMNGQDIQEKASCRTTTVQETVGGLNNTFTVRNLAVGGIYNIELQASNEGGSSNITTGTLFVRSFLSDTAPMNIVAERSRSSYDLSWETREPEQHGELRYFVHNCFALPVPLRQLGENQSSEISEPLECVNNMQTHQVKGNGFNSFFFEMVPQYEGLKPAFFLSTQTSDGVTSGLQQVDCFYTRNEYPEIVVPRWHIADQEPGKLMVSFDLPCGRDINYKSGRPRQYSIGVMEHNKLCGTDCNSLMANSDPEMVLIKGSLKARVKHTLSNLKPATTYCVGLRLLGHSNEGYGNRERWACTVGETTGEKREYWEEILIPIIVIVIVAAACFKIWKLFKREREKFVKPKRLESKCDFQFSNPMLVGTSDSALSDGHKLSFAVSAIVKQENADVENQHNLNDLHSVSSGSSYSTGNAEDVDEEDENSEPELENLMNVVNSHQSRYNDVPILGRRPENTTVGDDSAGHNGNSQPELENLMDVINSPRSSNKTVVCDDSKAADVTDYGDLDEEGNSHSELENLLDVINGPGSSSNKNLMFGGQKPGDVPKDGDSDEEGNSQPELENLMDVINGQGSSRRSSDITHFDTQDEENSPPELEDLLAVINAHRSFENQVSLDQGRPLKVSCSDDSQEEDVPNVRDDKDSSSSDSSDDSTEKVAVASCPRYQAVSQAAAAAKPAGLNLQSPQRRNNNVDKEEEKARKEDRDVDGEKTEEEQDAPISHSPCHSDVLKRNSPVIPPRSLFEGSEARAAGKAFPSPDVRYSQVCALEKSNACRATNPTGSSNLLKNTLPTLPLVQQSLANVGVSAKDNLSQSCGKSKSDRLRHTNDFQRSVSEEQAVGAKASAEKVDSFVSGGLAKALGRHSGDSGIESESAKNTDTDSLSSSQNSLTGTSNLLQTLEECSESQAIT